MNINNQEKGITLIALVVTIIVLIILAGIAINIIIGQNGIINKVTIAKEKNYMAQAEEKLKLVIADWKIEKTTGSKTITEYFENKVPKEIDEFIDMEDGTYQLEKDGYAIAIDENGNIVVEIGKTISKPEISNLKIISLEDGTEVEDNSQVSGTKLKITFDVAINDGEIIDIVPKDCVLNNGKVTYITNGTDKSIKFIVTGKVNESTGKTIKKVSVENKYLLSKESLIDAVKDIEQSSKSRKIQIDGKNSKGNIETEVYSADIVYVEGDLILGKDGNAATNIDNLSFSNNTYSVGDADNDCANGTSEDNMAKNMVILKVNGNLTIDSEVILTSCVNSSGYGGPKGLFIYCTGTITNNGTIDMTARGAYAKGQNVYLYKNADSSYETVPAVGATGGASVAKVDPRGDNGVAGKKGENGSLRQTGGGGSGDAYGTSFATSGYSGRGGIGTSYSGGTGRRRNL